MWAGYFEKYPQSFLQKKIGIEDNWYTNTEDTVEQLSGGITGCVEYNCPVELLVVWNTTVWWNYWLCGIQRSGGITGRWNTAVWKLMGTANWCNNTEDIVEQLSSGITGILGQVRGATVELTEIFCGCGVK